MLCAPDASYRTYAHLFKSSRSDTAVFHYSFFTIHCSLYPLGAITNEKPRLAACSNETWESHAAGSRRKTAAGTARRKDWGVRNPEHSVNIHEKT